MKGRLEEERLQEMGFKISFLVRKNPRKSDERLSDSKRIHCNFMGGAGGAVGKMYGSTVG